MNKNIFANNRMAGALLVILAAVSWGMAGVLSQFLFNAGVEPNWLLSVRITLSGIILVAAGAVKQGRGVFNVWKDRASVGRLFVFAIFGSGLIQLSYLYAINASNAATATFLQYISPAMVVAAMAVINKKFPSGAEIICMILAITGTFLIATHGSITHIDISADALVWGIVSAASLAFYTIYPKRMMQRYTTQVFLGWSMIAAGAVMCIATRPWQHMPQLTMLQTALLAFVIIMGTVVAFSVYSMGIMKVGETWGSILATVEPLASAVFSFIIVGVRFQPMDYVGFICIIMITVILALKKTE